MTLAEKIATKPDLERIDSSIESCFKILNQEIDKKIESFELRQKFVPLYLRQTKMNLSIAHELFIKYNL